MVMNSFLLMTNKPAESSILTLAQELVLISLSFIRLEENKLSNKKESCNKVLVNYSWFVLLHYSQ